MKATPPEKKVDREKVIQMYMDGNTYTAISRATGVTASYAKKIIFEERKAGNVPPVPPPKEPKIFNDRYIPKGTDEEEAEKALANWKKSHYAVAMREDKADLNRAAGAFVIECMKMGRMVNKKDPESLMEGLRNYVQLATIAGMPMLVKTACLSLGVSSYEISCWRRGIQGKGDPRFKEFAETFTAVIGAGIEAAAAAGSIDRVLTIWWEKAHFNMIEGNGVEAEPESPLGERLNGEDIIAKYKDLPD